MKLNQKQLQHLLWRSGFGESYSYTRAHTGKDHLQMVDDIFEASSAYEPVQIEDLIAFNALKQELPKEEKKQLYQKNAQNLRDIPHAWTVKMAHGKGVLREKMAVFWHNHFACSVKNPTLTLNYLNTIRKNALGNFDTMLREVSKEPAMLKYLDNQSNRKGKPNENFAREVMELFTLGRGNYSEHDIREAARAFTGWRMNSEGYFEFHRNAHDEGIKTVFGKTGHFDGDDILDMLLENKLTAKRVCSKLYRYLVNDQTDEARVTALSDTFYSSGYDIGELLQTILKADWFYDKENTGTLIKSPVDLQIGIQRAFHIRINDSGTTAYLQKMMGQQLLFPPNVAGWPGGRNWIDSNSVMLRSNLSKMLLRAEITELVPKRSFDDNDPFSRIKDAKRLNSTIDSAALQKDIELFSDNRLVTEMTDFLFQVPFDASINPATELTKTEQFINTALMLSKRPEYQMC